MAETTDNSGRTIGQRLLAARELAGVSPTVAAERLHLDPKVIEALEADRFDELGAPVYVRGHLRRYAEFLGEPADALVAEYQASRSAGSAPDLTRIPKAESPSAPKNFLGPAIAAGVAVALGIAAWFVLQRSQPQADPVAAAPEVVAEPDLSAVETPPPVDPAVVGAPSVAPAPATVTPAAPSVAPAGEAAAQGPASTPPTVASNAADAPATAPTTATPAQTTPTLAAATAAPAPAQTRAPADEPPARVEREMQLRLSFPADSWVEVYDARGRRLFYDVAASGSVQSFSGRGPLRVVLGNAAGVGVEVNGQGTAIPANAVRGDEAKFLVTTGGSLVRSR
jgi:cytoskeleton protein RodZ